MAGFTSLALVGAGMLASKLFGGKKTNPQDQTLAPGSTPQPDAITPPAPPIVNPGEQQAASKAAGVKTRKRAAAGSLLTAPKAPASSTMPVGARLQPRSLLGS